MTRRQLILGAAGRDFHYFNTVCRDDPQIEVVAFTATQIPGIEGRLYPKEVSGPRYPEGVPILDEENLEQIIVDQQIDEAVMAYSDVAHVDVMHLASRVSATGANFVIPNTRAALLKSSKPVVAVTATRTGCGKSQTVRALATILKGQGVKAVVVRHPMPYGDLTRAVQRFESYDDMADQECTIEEREEYEPHVEAGHIVYAGVDYELILRAAEREADVVLWDGGNNDIPFFSPDLWICVTDPHRSGHGLSYHPGEINLRSASVIMINKIDSASEDQIRVAEETIAEVNPTAQVLKSFSPFRLDPETDLRGKKVLVVEDGPTVTHGGMGFGAGYLAAVQHGGSIVDPRPGLQGSLAATFEEYPHLENVLPAMGYGRDQISDLEATINAVDCDYVLTGSPIDLGRLLDVNRPMIRARYDLDPTSAGRLTTLVVNALDL